MPDVGFLKAPGKLQQDAMSTKGRPLMGFLDRAREKAEELAKQAKPAAQQAREKAGPMVQQAREKAGPMAEKMREGTGRAAKNLKQSADSFREGYRGDKDKPTT